MKIHINTRFDDDEKLLLQNFPADVTDDAVETAVNKGMETINRYLSEFLNVVQIYNYLGGKGGDFS